MAGPQWLAAEATAGDRLRFALAADLVIALWLGLSIGRLARHRFFTASDIDGSGLTGGSDRARVLQATLQNTLEQTVLAVLVHLVWAGVMPLDWIGVIPAAVLLFLAGRLLFVRGYARGAPSRALGFALTFYPSMLMLAIVVLWIAKGWLG